MSTGGSGIFTTYWYHRVTRKILAAVGAMFSDMKIGRYTGDQTLLLETIGVPFVFGQKEKYFVRNTQDPDLTRSIKQQYPIIVLQFEGLAYDAARKQQTTQYLQAFQPNVNGPSIGLKQLMGVPYNLNLKLSVVARNVEDAMQIVEQILPIFTPDYTLPIVVDEQIGLTKNFPVTLTDLSYTNTAEGVPEDLRTVAWDFGLKVQGWYTGPTTDPAIIKNVSVQLYTTTQGSDLTVLLLDTNGTGTFADSEAVFQGPNFDQAVATATVVSFDPRNSKLYIDSITGQFQANSNVTGQNTNSTWVVSNTYMPNSPAVQIYVTPNPPTANATDNYTINTQLNEFFA